MSYKRKVKIGDCTLYLGDCMEVMPTLGKVDAVVTDPPYGLGQPSGTMQKDRKNKRDYASHCDTYDNLIKNVIPAVCMALTKSNGRGILTPGAKHAWDYPKPQALGVFYQPASVGMCVWGRATQQPILFYGRDPRIGLTIQPTGMVLTERASNDLHPCAKPIKAWTWVVKRASINNEIVLDPFMGSGTTGVACVKLGRRFIGIELDEDYFNIACQRIQETYDQPDLFIEAKKPVAIQTDIFKGDAA